MTVTRLFLIINICGVLIYSYTLFMSSTMRTVFLPIFKTDTDLKYILYWTTKPSYPLEHLITGQHLFLNSGCTYSNCFVTTIKTYFGDNVTNFDAILFNGKDLTVWDPALLPQNRTKQQIYIFVSKETPDVHPICDSRANSFFNWTWTYKLNSDIINPFFEVRKDEESVVAPRENVKWIANTDLDDIPSGLSYQLKSKFRAVIWLTTDCHKDYENAEYVIELQRKLKIYKLHLDIYGPCGSRECPNNSIQECYEMIESDYFYQITFEKKQSVDYITGEVLTAMKHLTVPIVFGNDYNYFLPVGSYLNAKSLTISDMADFIVYSIRQRSIYLNFFRWHNSYTLTKAEDHAGICDLCMRLNINDVKKQSNKYENFLEWWHSSPYYVKTICNK